MEGNDRGSLICWQCHKIRTRYPRCVETPSFPFPGILVDPERFICVMDHWHTPHVGVPSRTVATSVVERTSASPVTLSVVLAIAPTNQLSVLLEPNCHNFDVCPTGIRARSTICRVARLDRTGMLFNSTKFRHCGTCPPSVHSHNRIFRISECVWG